MSRYAIHPDFAPIAHFQPPSAPWTLPLSNAFLSLFTLRSDREVRVERLHIPGHDGGTVPTLLVAPRELASPAPCLVYAHGGGFTLKASPHHYRMVRAYALRAGCLVLFPDYRLAPRFPFPAAAEDVFAVYRWAEHNAGKLGIDPGRLALGGDSAGGNLAAACALMARDRGAVLPCLQMLIYPVLDRRMETGSMAAFPDTPMWNSRKNREMWRMYLPALPEENLAYASPPEAPSLAGLPPAYIETARFDCLRDEGAAYARALEAQGVAVTLNETEGTVHGFDFIQSSGIVKQCMARRVEALRRAFGK